jgi:hypothetical protein
MDGELERRRQLTFRQAEGLDPLPRQLEPREIDAGMRVRLFKVVYDEITADARNGYLGSRWAAILRGYSLQVLNVFPDDFTTSVAWWRKELRSTFEHRSYADVLDATQFLLRRHPYGEPFGRKLEAALIESRSAYRVFGDTIAPISSEAEATVVAKAFAELKQSQMDGAQAHLRQAAEALSAGEWADSVRESVHALESVVRQLGKSNSVDDALRRLASKGHINPNMKAGFGRLYNYTSDEKGIRHPLLEDGDAKVDEADALYMFGASAAFVSYLLAKGRRAGLLASDSASH